MGITTSVAHSYSSQQHIKSEPLSDSSYWPNLCTSATHQIFVYYTTVLYNVIIYVLSYILYTIIISTDPIRHLHLAPPESCYSSAPIEVLLFNFLRSNKVLTTIIMSSPITLKRCPLGEETFTGKNSLHAHLTTGHAVKNNIFTIIKMVLSAATKTHCQFNNWVCAQKATYALSPTQTICLSSCSLTTCPHLHPPPL
jgi:hypothetical protein